MAQTPKGKHVSNPQQHALFGNSHSGIFQAQTSLETLKDPQRDFGPGIFHCVSSKTVHALMSLFHRNPQLFSAGVFDEKATVFDEKARVFDEKACGFFVTGKEDPRMGGQLPSPPTPTSVP